MPAEGELSAELQRALDAFDEPAAQTVLDRLLADLSVPAVLRTVVLPYLADLGQRWQRGTASIAMEHFPVWLPGIGRRRRHPGVALIAAGQVIGTV